MHGLLMEALRRPGPLVAVELRPPRADLETPLGISAWIDLHHTLRRLIREELFVFLTDNAVGAAEEENLAHVGGNVGDDADRRRIVPILTAKHSLDYCLMFASRAVSQGYDALTVLGGDRSVGPPRCVPRARELRETIRKRVPGLSLGAWVNPLKEPEEQVGFVGAAEAHADFALGQIVSHHALGEVERFLRVRERRAPALPVVFGVFFYRSANPATLETLGGFFPVPAREITRDFESGLGSEEICARTIRELRAAGADKIYVSNLGNRGAMARLGRILERV
jgi:hypothetical protein